LLADAALFAAAPITEWATLPYALGFGEFLVGQPEAFGVGGAVLDKKGAVNRWHAAIAWTGTAVLYVASRSIFCKLNDGTHC